MITREGSRPASAEQRLKELGIKLPAPPEPFGTYVEAVQTGNLLFLSGMLPTEGHGAKFIGRVGAEVDVEAGRKTSLEKTRAPAAWCMASQVFRSALQSSWRSFSRWRGKRGSKAELNDASFQLARSNPMLAGCPHSVGGFCDARIISIAGQSPGKGTSRGIPDFLSHHTDRWSLDLLQRGRPETRADASPAARTSLFIADVRASLHPAFRSLSHSRARLPGLRP